MPQIAALVVAALLVQDSPGAETAAASDPRTLYDVELYELALVVDPSVRELSGVVTVQVRVLAESLDAIELDLTERAQVESARVALAPSTSDAREHGRAVAFAHDGERLRCAIEPRAARKDETLSVAIAYRLAGNQPGERFGLRWSTTDDGKPWIATFSQPVGAHSWWPCKASFFHPEDKADRVEIAVTVPEGLVAVSNGRSLHEGGVQAIRPARAHGEAAQWRTFRWSHEYPISTFAVALAIGPYVETSTTLVLPEVKEPVPLRCWVLADSQADAAAEMADVPAIIAEFTRAFGPFPFPRAKIGVAQVSFLGMGHASLVSYGAGFPLAHAGAKDESRRPGWKYDRTLVHELAHEWWGNAVSARDWGEMWLHEGFATYAEGVWVEASAGRDEADRFFEQLARNVRKDAALLRERARTSREGYSLCLYDKGAVVLHTLRHYLDDDDAWWRSLREFQARHRYGFATTADFRAVVEETSGRDLERFFAEWIEGKGVPAVCGSVRAAPGALALEIECRSDGGAGFHVPLDLAWNDAQGERHERVELAPGPNRLTIPVAGTATDVRVLHLARLPGRHRVRVE